MKARLLKNGNLRIKKGALFICGIICTLLMAGCGKTAATPCDDILISGKNLKFGMTEAEVTALLGEPTESRVEAENGVKLTYKGLSVLNYASDTLELYIYTDAKTPDEASNRGLALIYGTFPTAYEKAIDKEFGKAYGDFIKRKSNYLSDLSSVSPDRFSYVYYSDKWALSTLGHETSNKVKSLYSSVSMEYTGDDPHLVNWQIYGSTDKDNPGCVFRVDGDLAAIYNRCVK